MKLSIYQYFLNLREKYGREEDITVFIHRVEIDAIMKEFGGVVSHMDAMYIKRGFYPDGLSCDGYRLKTFEIC